MERPLEVQDERFSRRRPIRFRQTTPEPVPDCPFVTTVTCLAEIVAEPVVWLWGDMIPQGKITLLTGTSGVGKSFVACDIAAAVTRGQRGPQREPLDEPADVLLISLEYELADLVRPRLEAADAAMSRIHAVRGVRRQNHEADDRHHEADDRPCWLFHLNEDLRLLEQEIGRRKEAGSPLGLIVIDPFPVELFDLRHDLSELNQTIKHLAEIAAWSQTAILLVTETPSQSRGHLARIVRALETTVQTAWTIVCDLDCSERRLVLPIKANLKEKSPGLSFRLRDGRVQWEADSVWLTAEQFRAESLARAQTLLYEQEWSELARATDWLQRRLKAGIVPLRIIKQESAANDISYTTLRRAFCGMRGISERTGLSRLWAWSLPKGDTVTVTFPPRLDLDGMGLDGDKDGPTVTDEEAPTVLDEQTVPDEEVRLGEG